MSHVVSPTVSHVVSPTVSHTALQPERVVHVIEDVAKATSLGGGAYATKSWKDKAIKVDINGYVTNMELKNIELVSHFLLKIL